jgi:hypothetical protein
MFFWILCGTGKSLLLTTTTTLTSRDIPKCSKDSLQRQPSRYPREDSRNINTRSGIQCLTPKRRHCIHGSPDRSILRQVRMANAFRYVSSAHSALVLMIVSIGAALYIVVFALIGLTTVHPTGPIVLSSFALSMNVIPFVGSIPILVNDPTKMGTAYGVWSSFVACNNILLEVTAGAIVRFPS